MALGANHPKFLANKIKPGEVRNPTGKRGAPKGTPLNRIRYWMKKSPQQIQEAWDRGKGTGWDAMALQFCLKASKGDWRAMKELLDREEGPIAQHQVHEHLQVNEGIELNVISPAQARAQADRMLEEKRALEAPNEEGAYTPGEDAGSEDGDPTSLAA